MYIDLFEWDKVHGNEANDDAIFYLRKIKYISMTVLFPRIAICFNLKKKFCTVVSFASAITTYMMN